MGPMPQDNPLIPPGQQPPPGNPLLPPGMQPPLIAPPPSPSMGFQAWASDPRNAGKVQTAMVAPGAPLQPNAPQGGMFDSSQFSALNPPQQASGQQPPAGGPTQPPVTAGAPTPMASANPPQAPQTPNPMTPPGYQPPGANLLPPGYQAAQAKQATDAAELQRLQTSGAGLNQIKNPVGRGFARAGDIALSILTPKAAPFIPGTTAHNQQLQGQAAGRVAQDQAAITGAFTGQQAAANLQHTKAETDNLASGAQLKNKTYQLQLAKAGLKPELDDKGNINLVPDTDSNAYQQQQLQQELTNAHIGSYKAGSELKAAQTAYDQAKLNPGSPLFQQAQQRLSTAQANAATAQKRLDLSTKTFLMRSQGVDENGNAYSGAMLDDNGNPIGTAFQQNVRPTGTERNKADMAGSAADQLGTIKDILQKRSDIFGPVAGRTTDFNVWLGSQDPDAQRFRAARTIAGDHLAGTFGGRSEAALSALDSAIGQFKDNPTAALAGVDQLTKANQRFLEAGTVKTAGSKAGGAKPNPMAPPTQAPKAYAQTATGPNGHKIGSNDGKTWVDVKTGKAVQ